MNINNSKQQYSELNQILNQWDPIGVLPYEGGPEDEYSCFIHPILAILEAKKGEKDLTHFLNTHLQEHIGMLPQRDQVKKIVMRILEWWGK